MTDDLRRLRELVGGAGPLEPPKVEPIEPQIRTGTQYAAPAAPVALARAKNEGYNTVVAKNCLNIWGFDVIVGREEDFHAWLRGNEHNLADACPEGVHYLGTYVADARAPRGSGAYRTFWSFHSFDALGRFGDAAADPRSAFGRLLREFGAFKDKDRAAGGSELMAQRAAVVVRY